ncbi:MAG: flagellar hook protein FlgE [bacterium]|nr:flagellar hook protein FlgE [bacterium]
MIGSLYTGASGVKSHSKEMTITGSNIANVNTVGFKYNRVNFEDMVATSVAGGDKIGKGVQIANIQNIQSQGTFESTENETDLAIDGKGFFAVKDKAGQTYYTRAGQFTYDKEGYLTSQDGKYLQIKDVGPEGNTVGNLKRLNVLDQIDPPTPTGDGVKEGTGVNVIANLDSNAKEPKLSVDYDNVTAEMYNFSSSVTVYDTKGQEHLVNVVFRKLADKGPDIDPATNQPIAGTERKNQWQWMALSQGEDLAGGLPGTSKAVGGGFLEFSNDGRLVRELGGEIVQPPVAAGAPPDTPPPAKTMNQVERGEGEVPQVGFTFTGSDQAQQIGFAFGKGSNPNDPLDTRSGVDGITQFANEFKLIEANADGMKSGKIESIYIKQDGTVQGSFDSGNTKSLGRIILTDFKATEKLAQLGKNLYKQTFEAGPPIENDPGQNGSGTVNSKTLERSNVELSNEFVNMIEGQRAFQANAKTVTTSDEVLADMIQMKR